MQAKIPPVQVTALSLVPTQYASPLGHRQLPPGCPTPSCINKNLFPYSRFNFIQNKKHYAVLGPKPTYRVPIDIANAHTKRDHYRNNENQTSSHRKPACKFQPVCAFLKNKTH
jgi:hypothetical protein